VCALAAAGWRTKSMSERSDLIVMWTGGLAAARHGCPIFGAPRSLAGCLSQQPTSSQPHPGNGHFPLDTFPSDISPFRRTAAISARAGNSKFLGCRFLKVFIKT